jgi:hypothetical protein
MASDAAVRLVNPAGAEVIVLVGGPRRLKGRLRLVNDSAEPITVSAAALTAEVPAVAAKKPQLPVLERWVPQVVAPGEASPVTVTVALDSLTPPGTYQATLIVEGQSRPVELQVVEVISLTLSPSEVVVSGEPDVAQTKTVVITNTGNVALAVSHVGPVPLVIDERRASLLERLGVLERPAETEPLLAVIDEADDDEDEPPVVEAQIEPPVVIQPGEARPVSCTVTVRGTIDAGLRYRADGALYTADLRFVVVPPQRTPPEPTKRSRSRTGARGAAAKPPSAEATPKKARSTKTTKSQAATTRRTKSAARTTQHRRQP